MKLISCSSCTHVHVNVEILLMVSAAGGSLQVMSLIFSSLKMYFPLSSHRYWSGWSWFTDWDQHTQRDSSAPPLPHFDISACFHMQSNRVVGQTDGCETAGQRVQQQRDTYMSRSVDECYCLICVSSWCTWLLKGMADNTQIGLISVNKNGNTTSLCPEYLRFNY